MHKQIINKFINQFKSKHGNDKIEIIGIFGFVSKFIRKKINLNSDLDIYIVIKNIGKHYRGVTNVDLLEIDYFVKPIEQLKLDWEKIKNKSIIKKTFAYMLRDGKIILDQNDELKKLKREARDFLKSELENNEMSGPVLILTKYFISDYLKDIEDSLVDNNIFSWQYNVASLLNYLVEVFCMFHKIPLLKQKYQGAEIAKKDKKFVKMYESISGVASRKKQFEKIKILALYCLENLGGELPKEWELERKTEVMSG